MLWALKRVLPNDRTSSVVPHFPRLLPSKPSAMTLSLLLLGSSKSTHAEIDKGLDNLFKSSATVCNGMRKFINGVIDHLTLLCPWLLNGPRQPTLLALFVFPQSGTLNFTLDADTLTFASYSFDPYSTPWITVIVHTQGIS